MKNYQQRGDVIEVAAAAVVVSGQVVALGAVLAVANHGAAQGEPYNALRVGTFVAPKATGVAFAQGGPVMWDESAGKFAAAGAPAVGDITGAAVAFEAAAPETTLRPCFKICLTTSILNSSGSRCALIWTPI